MNSDCGTVPLHWLVRRFQTSYNQSPEMSGRFQHKDNILFFKKVLMYQKNILRSVQEAFWDVMKFFWDVRTFCETDWADLCVSAEHDDGES